MSMLERMMPGVLSLLLTVQVVQGAIYVNGRSTSSYSNSGTESSSSDYWRVSDSVITLRGAGPFVIAGSGTMPVRCAPATGVVRQTLVLSNLTSTVKHATYAPLECGSSGTVDITIKGTNTLAATEYSTSKGQAAINCFSGNALCLRGDSQHARLICTKSLQRPSPCLRASFPSVSSPAAAYPNKNVHFS